MDSEKLGPHAVDPVYSIGALGIGAGAGIGAGGGAGAATGTKGAG